MNLPTWILRKVFRIKNKHTETAKEAFDRLDKEIDNTKELILAHNKVYTPYLLVEAMKIRSCIPESDNVEHMKEDLECLIKAIDTIEDTIKFQEDTFETLSVAAVVLSDRRVKLEAKIESLT